MYLHTTHCVHGWLGMVERVIGPHRVHVGKASHPKIHNHHIWADGHVHAT